jgi:hypothetical protein
MRDCSSVSTGRRPLSATSEDNLPGGRPSMHRRNRKRTRVIATLYARRSSCGDSALAEWARRSRAVGPSPNAFIGKFLKQFHNRTRRARSNRRFSHVLSAVFGSRDLVVRFIPIRRASLGQSSRCSSEMAWGKALSGLDDQGRNDGFKEDNAKRRPGDDLRSE